MDSKTIITMLVGIIIRGLVWLLAGKLGMEAEQAKALAGQLGYGIGAAILVGLSIWQSYQGRKKLLLTPPPPPASPFAP